MVVGAGGGPAVSVVRRLTRERRGVAGVVREVEGGWRGFGLPCFHVNLKREREYWFGFNFCFWFGLFPIGLGVGFKVV